VQQLKTSKHISSVRNFQPTIGTPLDSKVLGYYTTNCDYKPGWHVGLSVECQYLCTCFVLFLSTAHSTIHGLCNASKQV